jgi:hypothetical protein
MSQSNKEMITTVRKKVHKESSRSSDETPNKNHEGNKETQDKDSNLSTTDTGLGLDEKVKPKTILAALIQTLKSSSARPASKNGLYGDTSVPNEQQPVG